MGVAGLALAYSLAYILNFTFIMGILRFKIGHLDEKKFLLPFVNLVLLDFL